MSRLGMVIDTVRCVGCMDCVVACKPENKVTAGLNRDWVVEATAGRYPNLRTEFRSERCNHCATAPCVTACPTGAIVWLEKDGSVTKGRDAKKIIRKEPLPIQPDHT